MSLRTAGPFRWDQGLLVPVFGRRSTYCGRLWRSPPHAPHVHASWRRLAGSATSPPVEREGPPAGTPSGASKTYVHTMNLPRTPFPLYTTEKAQLQMESSLLPHVTDDVYAWQACVRRFSRCLCGGSMTHGVGCALGVDYDYRCTRGRAESPLYCTTARPMLMAACIWVRGTATWVMKSKTDDDTATLRARAEQGAQRYRKSLQAVTWPSHQVCPGLGLSWSTDRTQSCRSSEECAITFANGNTQEGTHLRGRGNQPTNGGISKLGCYGRLEKSLCNQGYLVIGDLLQLQMLNSIRSCI